MSKLSVLYLAVFVCFAFVSPDLNHACRTNYVLT